MKTFPILQSVVAVLALGLALSASAAELPAKDKSDIDALLHTLGSSGCAFYRNGNWYDAAKAETHLNKKLDYFVKKGEVSSATQFIALAATASSMSGEAYQVRCPGHDAVPSAVWLTSELERARALPATQSSGQ